MTGLPESTTAALADLAGQTAAWCDKAGLAAEADRLRALPAITGLDVLADAAATVNPIMHAAYRRSGVVSWPQAAAGADAARDAQVAKHAAGHSVGVDHFSKTYRRVNNYADWLWTTAVYAAHAAVTDGASR
ncbi:hypothetical protein GCM10011608_11080 [Micromonospora sonchi]|uniref:Uncharacterized protein n=1 Tax=Micromonospora sonchi TaxID=1763543 RepID=A0A917TLW2_9ACTN|nr:hypothetical protein [Micromonospora sonchi]GGM28013.1 hypothetical protein GCM10011608_11080 [Micromonospora sonchi]